MSSTDYDDESIYVKSIPSFQNLNTYNDYSVQPSPNDVRMAIYPTWGGAGYGTLSHSVPRSETKDCDYFSLGNAYQSSYPCTERCSTKVGYTK